MNRRRSILILLLLSLTPYIGTSLQPALLDHSHAPHPLVSR